MLRYTGDFERLKEFGFEYVNNIWKSRLYVWRTSIVANVSRIIIDKNRVVHINDACKKTYDLFYDLIKAGLIEKVVEEWVTLIKC